MSTPKIIHFICTGNTYRSRMAEAYFNSLNLPGLKAVSSGINAHTPSTGPIEWYSMRIIHDSRLIEGMSRDSKRTTVEMLKSSDLTIFMQQMHYDFCNNNLGYTPELYQIWDVADISPDGMTDREIIDYSENTFKLIKANVDKLVQELTA